MSNTSIAGTPGDNDAGHAAVVREQRRPLGTEDWWAVAIGLFVIVVAYVLFASGSSIKGIAVAPLSTMGVGARYAIGPATLHALWTHTNIEQLTGHMTTFNAYDAGGKYAFTPALTGALGYTYMQAKDLTNGHWNQIDASVDYALSKRTDVYLLGVYQDFSGKTAKNADLQAQIGSSASSYLPVAGADTQLAVRVGIRHKF